MRAWLPLLLITLANLLTGSLILWQWDQAPRWRVGYAARALGWGLAVNGWAAVILAEIGHFSLLSLGLLWLLFNLGLLLRRRPTRIWLRQLSASLHHPSGFLPLPLLLFSLLALWLYGRPHQFFKGAADAGVYINLAANIAHSGGILIHDPDLAALDARLYDHLLRPLPVGDVAPYLLLPGFYSTDPTQGQVVPQFYPLYPVWQAVALSLDDNNWQAGLLTTGLWAMLGGVGLYLTARQIGGPWAGALALAGLGLNGLQIWFARYPTTETLTQALLWLGLWTLTRWISRPAAPQAIEQATLAGLLLGQTLLARIDMFFLLAIPAGLWLEVWFRRQRPSRALLAFSAVLGALTLHAFGHAWWQSQPYFLSTYGYLLSVVVQQWPLWSSGLVGLGLMLWLAQHYHLRLTNGRAWGRWLRGGGAALILILLAYAWFLRPQATPLVYRDWYSGQDIQLFDHENLRRLGWYLSPWGVWLGGIGASWWVWRARRRYAFVIGVGLFFTVLYVWRIQANPHQVYAMRRYIPAAIPFLTLSAALLLAAGWRQSMAWQKALAGLATIAWLGNLAYLAPGLVSQVDDASLLEQLNALNARLQPHAVLLFNDPAAIGQGDILGTPLHFLYGQTVFDLRQTEGLDADALAEQVRAWTQTRAVYWLATSAGEPWPLAAFGLRDLGAYGIELVELEATYTQRPQTVTRNVLAGHLYQVVSP